MCNIFFCRSVFLTLCLSVFLSLYLTMTWNIPVDLFKDLVEDVVKLKGKPGEGEEGDHHHQHLDHLLKRSFNTVLVKLVWLVGKGCSTFFLLFIICRSRSSCAAPGVLELQRATAILWIRWWVDWWILPEKYKNKRLLWDSHHQGQVYWWIGWWILGKALCCVFNNLEILHWLAPEWKIGQFLSRRQ